MKTLPVIKGKLLPPTSEPLPELEQFRVFEGRSISDIVTSLNKEGSVKMKAKIISPENSSCDAILTYSKQGEIVKLSSPSFDLLFHTTGDASHTEIEGRKYISFTTNTGVLYISPSYFLK